MMRQKAGGFYHESAHIAPYFEFKKGVRIWHYSIIREDVEIGEGSQIGSHVYIDKGVKIGANCKIQNGCNIFTGVEIADDVFIGPGVTFTNVTNPRAAINRHDEFKRTRLGVGCTIGAGSVIICGNDIGDYALIGAGSVVTRTIRRHSLAYGDPAKPQRLICKCGDLSGELQELEGCEVCCKVCGEIFSLAGKE